MATYDLTKKTRASTGQRIIQLGPVDNTMRVIKLEKRINDQEQKLDKIYPNNSYPAPNSDV